MVSHISDTSSMHRIILLRIYLNPHCLSFLLLLSCLLLSLINWSRGKYLLFVLILHLIVIITLSAGYKSISKVIFFTVWYLLLLSPAFLLLSLIYTSIFVKALVHKIVLPLNCLLLSIIVGKISIISGIFKWDFRLSEAKSLIYVRFWET